MVVVVGISACISAYISACISACILLSNSFNIFWTSGTTCDAQAKNPAMLGETHKLSVVLWKTHISQEKGTTGARRNLNIRFCLEKHQTCLGEGRNGQQVRS